MSACRDFQELVSTALDGALAPGEQAHLDEHLTGCADCRAFREELGRAHAQVRQVTAVEPPPWLAARIMAQVHAEAAPRPSFWRGKVLPFLTRPEFQAASLLLVCVSSYYLLKSRPEATAPILEQAPEMKVAPEAPPAESQDKATGLRDAAPAARQAVPAPAASELEQRAETKAKKASPPAELDALGGVKGDGGVFTAPPPAAVAEVAPAAPAPAPPPAPKALGGVASGPVPTQENALAAGASTGKLQKQAERKDAPATRGADSAAAKARDEKEERLSSEDAPVALPVLWEPREAQGARATVEAELLALGAEIEEAPQTRALRARLEARRLPELLARLERRGRILAPRPQAAGRAGTVTVLIRW